MLTDDKHYLSSIHNNFFVNFFRQKIKQIELLCQDKTTRNRLKLMESYFLGAIIYV